MPFNAQLIDLLKSDPRFIDEDNELILAAVQDAAWKIDHDLVRLLLANGEMKAVFFSEIEGHWLFELNKFLDYIAQKNFLDNSYTRFKNRIGLTIDGKYLRERGEVALAWPYKDCVLEGGQTKEEEKRKEIFFNEILAQDEITRLFDPKVLTNFKRYTTDGEEEATDFRRDENGVIRENLIIKGNNLLALHTLKSQFRGQVKLIYIDPPYNIGGDSFGYNDSFNHSAWLTFMKDRLNIARQLLRQDGALFVQIDHHELAYLIVLLDELFGTKNRAQIISVKTASPSGFKAFNPGPIDVTEHILFYTKDKSCFPFKSNYVPANYHKNYNKYVEMVGDVSSWKVIPLKQKVLETTDFTSEKEAKNQFGSLYSQILDGLIADFAFQNADKVASIRDFHKPIKAIRDLQKESRKNKGQIYTYQKQDGSFTYVFRGGELTFYSRKINTLDGEPQVTELLSNFWDHISWAGIAKEGGVKLKNGKKPEKLIKQFLDMATSKEDIIMDFFSGSGTTAAVAHKMGRQFIGIEQLDYGKNDSIVRLKNVVNGDQTGISKAVDWQGGGDFVYCELMPYNEAYVDKIQAAETSDALVQLWREMAKNSFLNWYVSPQLPDEAVNEFIAIGQEENGLEKQKRLLAALLDKNQLYVNLSEIDDTRFNVSQADKALNQAFYGEASNG